MKCYMGHFGEASKTSPDELLAKINDLDKLISSNNAAIVSLNSEISSQEKQLSEAKNNLSNVDRIISKIMVLGSLADERMRAFNKTKISASIFT